ncbi:MAG TPA: MmgE/PrpD family protein [Burkholderiales bacterium]|nr:MmgE/PrpD family protein [Burkholderiales bacterium]
MEITRALAGFIVETRGSDIPAGARREAVRSLVNYVGCALGGSHHAAIDRALAALGPFAGPAQASVIGRRERIDCLHAALVNGMSAHVLDFDDTHLRTLLHPGVPVASTLLALAERRPLDGSGFLDAFVIGVDVACRVANAMYATHNVNWYITGTAGVLGAAAAAGRVLGLDEQRMVFALGVAATQSAGLREMAGTMCKAYTHGRSAQNGLLAALLAERGFTSSRRAIEAPRGLVNVLAPGSTLDEIAKDLGARYEILLNTYKPYACGVVAHPVIDGCIRLRNAHDLTPQSIATVRLRVHPLALKLTGIQAPRGALESKWSIYHSAAVAICDGTAGERQYTDERVNDSVVAALRATVSAEADPAVRDDEAHVALTLVDGRTVHAHVTHATGSAANPLTDDGLSAKFRGLAEDVLPAARIEALLDACWRVDRLPEVSDVARLAVP